ncbi:hypothetical protein EVAR_85214_1 [Eumeta japonica]|uniref:Uncharacterized protein n=1 Tax=Eumeta variegata TaxID=151549 RepID=A0A4C1VZN3_EUMVA|nr:hypothetical protein EVAR_85214_1 [Eumeta japonica]
MKTLINASIERADDFSEYLKNQKSVTVHEHCRKNYTRKYSIAAAKRQREKQEATTSALNPARKRSRYHHDCRVSFLKPPIGSKVGRPKDEATNLAMEEIFTYIENSDDYQFTLNELSNVCKTITLDYRTIKIRVKLKYGDKLNITKKSGGLTFICSKDNHHIFNQAWYKKKKMNKKEKRFGILETEAAIIREDIRAAVFDNSNYPPPGPMFKDLINEILESLTYYGTSDFKE